jgi:uncharacterized surface protein with fasciclin (FAS1) repeats
MQLYLDGSDALSLARLHTKGILKMHNVRKFVAAGFVAASFSLVPALASAQQGTVVARDTVITVHKDTVVHTREDTAVVTTRVTSGHATPAGSSIGATLARMPNYKTMTELLQQAHLMPTLLGAAPMTLFAPTDDAFAALPAGQLDAVRADSVRLRDFLLNMIVSGKIDTREILKLKTATNMHGSRIRFTYSNGMPRVNDQPIVQPGIMAANGFIYGIGGVLGM